MGSETQQEHKPFPGNEPRWLFGDDAGLVFASVGVRSARETFTFQRGDL